jgi:hypothetical protein
VTDAILQNNRSRVPRKTETTCLHETKHISKARANTAVHTQTGWHNAPRQGEDAAPPGHREADVQSTFLHSPAQAQQKDGTTVDKPQHICKDAHLCLLVHSKPRRQSHNPINSPDTFNCALTATGMRGTVPNCRRRVVLSRLSNSLSLHPQA